MRLILLRHAKSAWPEGVADEDRPLNGRGGRDAPAVGRWLAEHHPRLDAVLVSPAERAHQTWALVSAQLANPPRAVVEPELYACGPRAIVEAALATGAGTALVVSHNPDLEAAVALLTGEEVVLKTSSLAVVETVSGSLEGVHTLRGAKEAD